MPGKPVETTAPQTRKQGNEPVAHAWHPTAASAPGGLPPAMPHGLAPFPGASPQTLARVR